MIIDLVKTLYESTLYNVYSVISTAPIGRKKEEYGMPVYVFNAIIDRPILIINLTFDEEKKIGDAKIYKLADLEKGYLPKKLIVLYDEDGTGISQKYARLLRKKGYKAYYLIGGYRSYKRFIKYEGG